MKSFAILSVLFLFGSPTVFASSEEMTAQGIYRKGCFSCSAEASLSLSFEGSTVAAEITAPDEDCVMTFEAGTYVRELKSDTIFGFLDHVIYKLPVKDTCGRSSSFGKYRLLILEKNRAGAIKMVRIVGSHKASGASGWDYFKGRPTN